MKSHFSALLCLANFVELSVPNLITYLSDSIWSVIKKVISKNKIPRSDIGYHWAQTWLLLLFSSKLWLQPHQRQSIVYFATFVRIVGINLVSMLVRISIQLSDHILSCIKTRWMAKCNQARSQDFAQGGGTHQLWVGQIRITTTYLCSMPIHKLSFLPFLIQNRIRWKLPFFIYNIFFLENLLFI